MPHDIWATDGGIYLGYACDTIEGRPPALDPRVLLPYVGDRHLVTLGPNGSGKSRRLLLPNLARLVNWSILVIDPKAELAAMSLRHRHGAGCKTVLLNPFNVLGLGSHGFNPIAALDPGSDDFPDDALGLAEAIIRVPDKEPHWAESAQDLVAALIMYSRLTHSGGGSLGHVRSLLGKSAKEFRQVIEEMMVAGVEHDCEEIIVKSARFGEINSDSRELNGILSTALTQTRWLDSRPVKADLSRGAYDFARMKQEPTTVFLVLPARRLGTHSTWLRLMIASVLRPLMVDTRKAKVPTLLMLDEFAQLGHLPVIENTLAMMRGFGIKLWTVFQDLSQAKDIYKDRWESFLGNAGVLQAFAPQDVVTANYLSQRTGQSTRAVLSHSASRQGAANTPGGDNISLSQVGVPLMLPQDLRNMDEGFSVLFSHRAKGTIRSYFPYPTELPHLRDICRLDPSVSA
ncbi:MAG TPA: type IV secretory system conjugative DNA transfer family protein [Methylovirgula sp.]